MNRVWVWLRPLMLTLCAITICSAETMRWYQGPPPPLHPTVVFGEYKGQQRPIVGVRGDAPQIENESKLVTLPSSSSQYAPVRGARFAPGNIDLRAMDAGSMKTKLVLMFDTGGEVDGGTLRARSDFSATVVPSQDYKDCYVVVVFFNQAFLAGDSDDPGASVLFHHIGDLKGGRENKLHFGFGYLDFGQRDTGYFPLFFAHGLEICSSKAPTVARFFRKIEEVRHDRIVQGYRAKNVGKTLPPQAYLQIPPLFPEPAILADAPERVALSFMVNEEGRVESVEIADHVPPAVLTILKQTIGAWLFVPRMKDGYPMRTMVSLPLVLKEGAKSSATP